MSNSLKKQKNAINADLRKADLRGADLRSAYFENSDLRSAKLDRRIYKAKLRGVLAGGTLLCAEQPQDTEQIVCRAKRKPLPPCGTGVRCKLPLDFQTQVVETHTTPPLDERAPLAAK